MGLRPTDSLRRRAVGAGGGGGGTGWARVKGRFSGCEAEVGVELEAGGWLKVRARPQWAKLGSELQRWREKGMRRAPGGEKREEIKVLLM